MDEMDQLLRKLAKRPLPAGTIQRVALGFHRRRRRQQFFQFGLSTVFVLVGAFLFGPWLLDFFARLQLPDSGVSLLFSAMSTSSDTFQAVSHTWTKLNLMQASISRTLGLSEVFGMALLIAGALLGIDPLLPRGPQEPRMRSM